MGVLYLVSGHVGLDLGVVVVVACLGPFLCHAQGGDVPNHISPPPE